MNLFIIGSGFTKAVCPKSAPVNSELLEKLCKVPTNTAARELMRLYPAGDMELALTRMDMDIADPQYSSTSTPQPRLRQLREQINRELADFFKNVLQDAKHLQDADWKLRFAQEAIKAGDVALSLNYDCVFEAMLELAGKWTQKLGYGSSDNNLGGPLSTPRMILKAP